MFQIARQMSSEHNTSQTRLGPAQPVSLGNQALLQRLQAKLTVSQAGDPAELEADRVADQVMRMSEPPVVQRKCSSCEEDDKLQRKCTECNEQEKEKELQRKEGTAGSAAAPSIVHDVLRSSGRPLDPNMRAFMEPRFGRDFSQVRVHSGPHAAESARAVNALAYTVGQNVVFAENQYQPGSASGQRLLAHELTHVIQQTGPSNLMANDIGPSAGAHSSVLQRQNDPPDGQAPVQANLTFPSDFDTETNRRELALILSHEMADNQRAESIAVGWVILNRLLETKFHQIKQLQGFERADKPTQTQLALAGELLSGKIPDSTSGGKLYFSPKSMPDEANPGCCSGGSGACNLAHLKDKKDANCKRGLRIVPGTITEQRYFPDFATDKARCPQPAGTDPMAILVYKG